MAKYRKKPLTIEAVQFHHDKHPWPDGVIPWRTSYGDGSWGYIETLEGNLHVQDKAWIITGIAGEKYACDDKIFRASYDLVEEQEDEHE